MSSISTTTVSSLADRAREDTSAAVADLMHWAGSELTQHERLLIMLHYTEELTIEEVAAVLRIAPSEVAADLARVRGRVRKQLRGRR
jgi:DNA-directed RNA polymerase specialized sigma24 family protein